MAICFCQEVPRKVITSKHRELPKPPLQRGAGKGSGIPRKTQLRDSSYLVKSRIVVRVFCLFVSFPNLPGNLGKGRRKEMLPFSSENRIEAVAHHSWACLSHYFSVFHPKRSLHLISFTPPPSCSAQQREKRAQDRRLQEALTELYGQREEKFSRASEAMGGLQSQGQQRSPDKKSCPNIPCLPPSVQTPTSGGFPLPCSHSYAPDEHPERHLGWGSQPTRAAAFLL